MLTQEEMRFLHELVENYGDILEKYCRRCLHGIADRDQLAQDIVQTVFLNIIPNVHTLMNHDNVVGWLKTACYHRIVDEIRHRNCHPELLLPQEKLSAYTSQTGRSSDSTVSLDEVLAAAMKILTDDERAVFTDIFLNGYSMKETADRRQIKFTTVHSKVTTIRNKFQKYFFPLCILMIALRYLG